MSQSENASTRGHYPANAAPTKILLRYHLIELKDLTSAKLIVINSRTREDA
jgi:hypothetical protein